MATKKEKEAAKAKAAEIEAGAMAEAPVEEVKEVEAPVKATAEPTLAEINAKVNKSKGLTK